MRVTLKKSFKLNLQVLRALGLYPSEKHNQLHTCFAYILHTIAVLPLFVLGPLRIFLNGAIESNDYNGPITVGVILLCPKLFSFLINRDKVQKCIKYFDAAFAVVANDTQRAIIEKCEKICRRNSTFFFISVNFVLLGFYVKWFFQDYHRNLPLNVWLPFHSKTYPSLYLSVYALLVIGTTYTALVCGVMDPLVPGLFCHASGQLKILKDKLRNLDYYVGEETKKFSSQMPRAIVMYGKITEIVCHHKKIIHFVNECENCFSIMVFCQFMESMIIIGTCCIELTKIQDLNAFSLVTALNLPIVLFQVYFYCYYGTTVFEENNGVCTAIYMTNWYEYDIVSRRALLILMERSKRHMLLSAGKVLDLSLDTFTKILKTSYSLIAVLKNF